jgi:large subunit ribosomal protein L15
MELNKLTPAKGSVKSKKPRIGRGEGSGKGGTATKGHKGAKARSGYAKKIGFEGGQMPLQRRVPKFGFTNINRVEYKIINIDILQSLFEEGKIKSSVDFDSFIDLGYASKRDLIKILGRGELNSALTVKAHKFTKSAEEAILKAGGSVEILK